MRRKTLPCTEKEEGCLLTAYGDIRTESHVMVTKSHSTGQNHTRQNHREQTPTILKLTKSHDYDMKVGEN